MRTVEAHHVTVTVTLPPEVRADVTAELVMEELLGHGHDDARMDRDGHTLTVHVPVAATDPWDALERGAQAVRAALAGEPVVAVTAGVT